MPDDVYWDCVQQLRGELIADLPYVRPVERSCNAPFDQASQSPLFGAASERGCPEAFLSWASQRAHPAQQPLPPMNDDLESAIAFVARLGVRVVEERARRLRLFTAVASKLEPLSEHIGTLMSEAARDIARAMALNIERRHHPDACLADLPVDACYCVHFGLLGAILDALCWPDDRLVFKLVRGFQSVGDVPDSGVWRAVERPSAMPFSAFVASNASWVSECRARVLSAARSSPQRAHACYQRTLEELAAGLILGPFTVNDLNAKPGSWRFAFGFGRWRPLPRFAIWQGSKWRCIDDAAVSGSNVNGTSTHETIVCDRPDLPLRIGMRFHELGVPPDGVTRVVAMGGGSDDAFAAYRRVPTADLAFTVVMVPAPVDGGGWEARCFCVPGHNFGLTSAVLNFNCVPEPLVRFSRVFFGTPVVRFYDDETVHEPSYAVGSGQSTHFAFREALRFHFDFGKHLPWSSAPVFCGVCTDWSRERDGVVTLGVTEERKRKLVARVDDILVSQRLSPAEASSLRGKGRFCLSPVFGRMGIAILSAFRRRQYEDRSSDLTPELVESLHALRTAVRTFPNFSVPLRRVLHPPVVVLSDASWERHHTWMGFVVMCPIHGIYWGGIPTPPWLLDWLARLHEKKTYIGQLELMAALAPYWSLPSRVFAGRAVSHYVDNQGALYSLIRGRSSDADSNRLVFLARLRLHLLRADVWFDYVPSASNIADLPTRLDASAYQRLLALGPRVPCLLPEQSVLSASWDDLVLLLSRGL